METRFLNAADLKAYRKIRTQALEDHPESFGMSPEEFSQYSDDMISRQLTGGLPENGTIGAFVDDELVGIVNVHRHHRQKTRHRAHINAMYVRPDQRGKQLGKLLMEAAIDHIRDIGDVQQVVLAVTAGNKAAHSLYSGMGFKTWGIDPAYIRVGDVYHDIECMILWLNVST